MQSQLIQFSKLLMGLTKMLSILLCKISRVLLRATELPESVNVNEYGVERKKEGMDGSGWRRMRESEKILIMKSCPVLREKPTKQIVPTKIGLRLD